MDDCHAEIRRAREISLRKAATTSAPLSLSDSSAGKASDTVERRSDESRILIERTRYASATSWRDIWPDARARREQTMVSIGPRRYWERYKGLLSVRDMDVDVNSES